MRLILLALLTLAVGAPAQPPLPAFQGGGPLRGVAEPVGPPPYATRWHVKLDDIAPDGAGDGRTSVESNLTIVGDTVYVPDAIGVLHALDLATGKVKWQYKSEGGFATTPLVVGNKLFVGDLDGRMHCVSADKGQKIWIFDTEGQSIHASPNLTPDGKLILFGNDSAQVFALDLDGKKVWEGKGGDRINACPAVGFDAAFFTGCDARLLALNLKDGTEKFAVELGGMAPGSPALLDDRIVIGTGEGTVVALSPDGQKELWKYADVDESQAMFYSSPAVADGVAVIGCRDRQVHAIDVNTGKRLWAFKTRGEVDATPVISGGRAYVGSKDKKFYAFELKTGKKLWEFTAGRAITAGPAIANGVIVLGDTAGNVYCFEPQKN